MWRRVLLFLFEEGEESQDAQAVDDGTQPADYPRGDVADQAFCPEWLPAINIREMNLNHRKVNGENGVPDGDAGVGIGAEIGDDPAIPSSAAWWIRSIRAPSWFDWKKTGENPSSWPIRRISSWISPRVFRPYWAGSRVPRRFRFGP